MSFFGGGQPQGPDALEAAKLEYFAISDNFTKMNETCFKKCIHKYNESDLSVGEMTCIDRCSWKFMESQFKMQSVMKNFEEQAQQQEIVKQQMEAALIGKK